MRARPAADATWMMREGFAFGEVRYATQRVIVLELESRGAVEQLALGLTLLDEKLAAKILLLGYKDTSLTIRAGAGNAFRASGDTLSVALDGNTLGHLKVFVLTAARDGLASVDHTDIDLWDSEPATPPASLTVRIPQTAR